MVASMGKEKAAALWDEAYAEESASLDEKFEAMEASLCQMEG